MTGLTALLVVDVQEDYLGSSALSPDRASVISGLSELLEKFRNRGLPVAHIRTEVSADGSTAMPHRKAAPRCVAGTPGVKPPLEAAELAGEPVFLKQFFRGFVDPSLDAWLLQRGVTSVVVAGLYTHACIRETVLDAYERGFDVTIAADALGSDSPDHAAETLAWIGTRAASVSTTADIVSTLPDAAQATSTDNWGSRARSAQQAWALTPVTERVKVLQALAHTIRSARAELAEQICTEVGKPITLALGEVDRAVDHIHAAIKLADRVGEIEVIAPGVTVSYEPVGVVAAIMPWNNPLALPVSKIAPALLTGNAVAFKPSPFGKLTGLRLIELAAQSGVPTDLVTLRDGDEREGANLVRSPAVDAVTVTGSISTGRQIARECVTLGKPVQAELGGNNAAIILPDADLETVVPALAANAFVFAGQRCTAVRRFVVHADIAEDFMARMLKQISALTVGDPSDETTLVGPVISEQASTRIQKQIELAEATGAQVLAPAKLSSHAGRSYISPTLLLSDDPNNTIVQNETFGPVAVIQVAGDLDHAIELANGVEQGLVLFVCTEDATARASIAANAQVGMVAFGAGSLPVNADAPFTGRKASGIGTPEHGRWDLDFYQRPQTYYS
jgi:aldehyde dehydrogenase (NAD+)